jgi:hypothetical protein
VSSKLPPGVEPPLFTSRNPPKTRTEKVITAIEGDDEFSVASVDPDSRPSLELRPRETQGRTESTGHRGTLWRMFRKIFD